MQDLAGNNNNYWQLQSADEDEPSVFQLLRSRIHTTWKQSHQKAGRVIIQSITVNITDENKTEKSPK